MKQLLKMQLGATRSVLKKNVDGLTHEESLVAPSDGGNCANWVAGHLVRAYDDFLDSIGQDRVLSEEESAPYKRGCAPLTDPTEAIGLDRLLEAFDESHHRTMQAISSLPDDRWTDPAPYSPGNNPEETLGSLLYVLAFHQAYHVGQLGILRRLSGLEGAIK